MRWRREAVILLVFTLALALFLPSALAAEIDSEIYTQLGQNSQVSVIIEYKNPSDIKISGVDTKSLESNKVFSATISQSKLQQLRQDSNVKAIYYDYPVKANLDVSTGIVNATQVWDIQFDSQNIRGQGQSVCVIDTGINYTNASLGGCEAIGEGCKVLDGIDYANDDADPMDDNGHGSHVAGIIASTDGTYRGVAPDANLIAIKSLNAGGTGYSSNVTAGINWCINNKDTYNIASIVMSLSAYHPNGTEKTFHNYCDDEPSSLIPAINDAVGAGLLVAVSSGNSAESASIGLPACATNSTSVGATDDEDNRASYSNVASILDLFAPGSSIRSVSFDDDGFTDKSGTSMAAPHVAAAAALLQQYEKLESVALTPQQIENALRNTGILVQVSSLNFTRIDIRGALNSIDDTAPGSIYDFNIDDYDVRSVYFYWSDPDDTDLVHAQIYLNGVAYANTTDQEYEITGLLANTTYEILVYAVDGGGNKAEGIGDNVTTTEDLEQPTIYLNSPEGGEISEGTLIELSITDDWGINFASYSVNDGNNITLVDPWDIDTNGWTAGSKIVKVLAIDAGNNTDEDTFEFTVTNVLPVIGDIYPNATDVKGIINFNATVTDAEGQNDIAVVNFFALNNSNWVLIGNDTAPTDDPENLFNVSFNSALIIDGATTLRVNASDDDGTITKDVSITINNVNDAPTTTVTVPNGGETVAGSYAINWTASDPENNTLTYDVYYYVQGAGAQTAICSDITVKTCVWTSNNVTNGAGYRINVTTTDGINWISDSSNSNFTVTNSAGSSSSSSSSDSGATGEVTVPSGGGLGTPAEPTSEEIVQITEIPLDAATTETNNGADITGAFSLNNLIANPKIAAIVIGGLAAAGAAAFFFLRGGGNMPKFKLP
ncbi:MAG: S8 family serine peptidase, partial [Nanoarchaeota archaeon]